MVYNVEKMLKEHRDKISEADAKTIEAALEETKKAMQEGGAEQINAARDKLTRPATSWPRRCTARRRAAAGRPGGAPGDGGTGPQQEQQPEETTSSTPSSWTWTTRRSKRLVGGGRGRTRPRVPDQMNLCPQRARTITKRSGCRAGPVRTRSARRTAAWRASTIPI